MKVSHLHFLILLFGVALPLHGQDSLATLRVRVQQDSTLLRGAMVRAGAAVHTTNATGVAILRLMPGPHEIIVARIGSRPDTTRLQLRSGQDTTVTVQLKQTEIEVEEIRVSATRGERRVEDTPLRVEVIDQEEVQEKVSMTPGDILMMLNETSGLRVQNTSPSLGGAGVRIQGLAGRYSLLLADGLPLYGGQGGGLGLLQVPPVDLGRVEVIKGTASALYGSAALGGVVNLISRRPAYDPEQTLLLNQTSRGGTDGVLFASGPFAESWGYSLLIGAHRQRQNDLDNDDWTDMPGYQRLVLRPRLYFDNHEGRSAYLTAGYTWEDRDGGSLPGTNAPNGVPYLESLCTNRPDIGGVMRWQFGDSSAILSLRGSIMHQLHEHRFGAVTENDHHSTLFGEAALTMPGGRATYVAGVAYQQDNYRADNVTGFDYHYRTPAVFGQIDFDATRALVLSGSLRVDAHNEYGTSYSPRVSLLLRQPDENGKLAGWSARLSGGTGTFAPTPFTEETEVMGLTPLLPLRDLVAEKGRSASFDVGGPIKISAGRLELNATLFASAVRGPLQLRDTLGMTDAGLIRVALVNAPQPDRNMGIELMARLIHELGDDRALRVTASYSYLKSTSCDQDATDVAVCPRRVTPLNPKHTAGLVASVEHEGVSRIGLELYYTGVQSLSENPYRSESKPYLVVGLLAEKKFGRVRLFINGENLSDVRQTREDPLLLPSAGRGGRWTTDVWSLLEGRTINAGVKLEM